MPPGRTRRLALWAGLVLAACFFLTGLAEIPFHPDESTQLFMSADFERLLASPSDLFWDSNREADLPQRYRELDAPLARTWIGLVRSLARQPALPADWDWSQTWEQNQASGAVPTPRLLFLGRLASMLLLPASLALIFTAGRKLGQGLAGWIAALLLGTNALVLLHARRAMAEGVLLFGVLLALGSFFEGHRRPWLAGLCAAVAFAAKQTSLALVPVGLLAVLWLPGQGPRCGRARLRNVSEFLLAFVLVVLAMHPLAWRKPLQVIQASWVARQALLARQVALGRELLPQTLAETPTERMATLLANLFFTPPTFHEVGNYAAQTAPAEAAYLTNPLHHLGRSLPGGAFLLALALFGFLAAIAQVRQATPEKKRILGLAVAATICLAGGLVAAVPLTFQRYVIPLAPFSCLWTAVGVEQLARLIIKTPPR